MPETTQAPLVAAVDLTAGVCRAAARTAAHAARDPLRWSRAAVDALARVAAPAVAGMAGNAPERLRASGEQVRERGRARAEDWLRVAVPRLVDIVLDQIDLTELVLHRVDLDRVAEALDVDAVAARLDLDAVADGLDVGRVLDRLDLTELVEQRVDLNRVADGLDVERVLDRLDLTEVVLQRVDLNLVAASLDVDAVAERLDLDRVAARLDVDGVASRIDLDAIIDRLDLIALAEYVVNGIDLPRIIRESTGSVASESLRGVRTRSIEADQALAQFVDRLLWRRRSARSRRTVDASSSVEALETAIERAMDNAGENGAVGVPVARADGSRAD